MKASTVALALGVAVAAAGIGTALAQGDALQVIDQRQNTMKAQGKDLAAIKAFTEGKGDIAAARTAGAQLTKTIPAIPTLFPQKTGMAEYPGKSFAKPEIWAQWDKFVAAVNNANARAAELNAALASGDRAAVTTALDTMGKNGCGGCHTPFRQPKS
jgi:cytochrome c556